jgi:hypothetical protein
MSEPEVEWFVERIKIMLQEIIDLIHEPTITNSKREIISFNANEIETDLVIIVRKLNDRNKTR